ncbi:MAG TPA: polysaccharide deacetylase family protein [Armatimonadota bacterium]|nr:polysaccharide deacetylase family protein [Armatimonadota bacterium]
MGNALDTSHGPVKVNIPGGLRAAIALSYDTDSGGGYLEPMVCHGRTPPFLHEYMLRLCDTAEQHGVRLHFMQICDGLEEPRVVESLKEILARGHIVDSHTYTHILLVTDDLEALDHELSLSNRLIEDRLGWNSTLLRGPGGYDQGLDGLEANQEIILKNGFKWVSGRYCFSEYNQGLHASIEAPTREAPYAYPTGLIEIPIQSHTDRMWFDSNAAGQEIDDEAYREFRIAYGDKPVPDGWRCTWTPPGALDAWIEHILATADYAYDNGLLWTPAWHPYSHYIHDPENRVLPALLEHCAAKPEPFPVYTLRDIADWLEPAEAS